jgi:hypothetical protein
MQKRHRHLSFAKVCVVPMGYLSALFRCQTVGFRQCRVSGVGDLSHYFDFFCCRS